MQSWRIYFLLDSVRYHDDVKMTSKVWLVQSQDPDVRLLISQIDIVRCFIYNISAMSWRYRRHHPNFVTISECPLGSFLKSATLFISTNTNVYTKLLTSSESLVKVKFRLTETFLVIFLTSAVISKHLLFHENTIL